MKREILFRGKTFAGSWVYGHYQSINIPDRIYHSISNREVIPESVGQFTGLLDKNGNKIFEGDLLSERGDSPMQIVWQSYSCQWIAKYTQKEGRGYREISYRYCNEYKIIGNIHDNPELL